MISLLSCLQCSAIPVHYPQSGWPSRVALGVLSFLRVIFLLFHLETSLSKLYFDLIPIGFQVVIKISPVHISLVDLYEVFGCLLFFPLPSWHFPRTYQQLDIYLNYVQILKKLSVSSQWYVQVNRKQLWIICSYKITYSIPIPMLNKNMYFFFSI